MPGEDRCGDGVVEVVEVVAPLLPVVADLAADERRASCTQGMQPRVVSQVKRQNGILAMPAGSEMKVRMIGSIREKKTVASPWRWNQSSAHARCLGLMWMSRFFSSSSTRP